MIFRFPTSNTNLLFADLCNLGRFGKGKKEAGRSKFISAGRFAGGS